MSLEQGFSELIEWARTTPDRAEDFFDRALQELQDKGLLVQGTLDAVIRAARHTVADGLLVVAVFATAFFYRFNTLGGALGGFTNDEFGYLARGRQIQSGELPFRDFNDPGWILTDTLSGLAQWLGGYNLRSEALLTVGMLSLGAALTFRARAKGVGVDGSRRCWRSPSTSRSTRVTTTIRRSCSTPPASRSRGPMSTSRGAGGLPRSARSSASRSCSGTTTSSISARSSC